MGNKKGNVLVVVLVTLLIVSVGTVGYFFWQNQNLKFPATTPPTESIPAKPTPVSDKTTNWKTYTNNKYGYSVKYPNDYSYTEIPPDYVRFSQDPNNVVQSETYLSIQFDTNPNPSKNPAAIYKTTPDGKTLRISEIMMNINTSQKPQVQSVFDQILSTFKFFDQNPEGIFCGGIAGKSCAAGYKCQLDGNYPDAGGKCIKN